MTRPASRRRNEAGFTLLEVLVALGIVAMTLGALFQVVSSSAIGSERSSEHVRLAALAESLFDRLGRDLALESGEQSGAFDDGTAWTLSIEPTEDDAGARATGPARLYRVRLEIVASETESAGSLVLNTLRLAPQG